MTEFCHDFCHVLLSVSAPAACVSGSIADLAQIKDMVQSMLEGSDQETLCRQQGSETSGQILLGWKAPEPTFDW